jgi:hypothetical protein
LNRRSFIAALISIPLVSGISYVLYSKLGSSIKNNNPDVLAFLRKNKDRLPLHGLGTLLAYPEVIDLDKNANTQQQIATLEAFLLRCGDEGIKNRENDLASFIQEWIEVDFEQDKTRFVESWLLADTQFALLILDVYYDVL